MIISGICPSTEIWGGVRRYFEMGNSLVKLGHDYTFYYQHKLRPPWINYLGKLRPISEIKKQHHDVLFTGARECMKELEKVEADTKVVLVVASNYTQNYLDCWNGPGKDYLWIGVSRIWQKQFLPTVIEGYTCPGGVNTDFFYPIRKRNNKIKLCSFYGKKYGDPKDPVLDYNYVVSEIEKFISKYGKNIYKFIAFDSVYHHYPEFIEMTVNRNQRDLRRILQQSDVFISPKRKGVWNNTVVESLACGTPVICFPEEVIDTMEDGITGKLILPNFGIYEALKWFMEDETRFSNCGQAGYLKVQEFSWDNYINKFLKIVENWKTNEI